MALRTSRVKSTKRRICWAKPKNGRYCFAFRRYFLYTFDRNPDVLEILVLANFISPSTLESLSHCPQTSKSFAFVAMLIPGTFLSSPATATRTSTFKLTRVLRRRRLGGIFIPCLVVNWLGSSDMYRVFSNPNPPRRKLLYQQQSPTTLLHLTFRGLG